MGIERPKQYTPEEIKEKNLDMEYERIVNLLAHKEIKEMLNSRNLHIGSQIKLTLKEPGGD